MAVRNQPFLYCYNHHLRLTWAVLDTDAAILVFGVRVGLQLEGELVVDQRLGAACFTGPTIIEMPAGLE